MKIKTILTNYWKGYLYENCTPWINKAKEADSKGNNLIVFEIPKSKNYLITEIEHFLQKELDDTNN